MSTDIYFDFTPVGGTWPEDKTTQCVAQSGWLLRESNYDRWERFCKDYSDEEHRLDTPLTLPAIKRMVLDWGMLYIEACNLLPRGTRRAFREIAYKPISFPLDPTVPRTFMYAPTIIRHILTTNAGKTLYIRCD